MGGAGLRGARNERRCAGVVDGAGLAGGEMSEDPLDDLASSLRERHFRGGEAGDAKSAGLPICTAGGCPEGVRHTDVPHELHRVEHDMSRPVVEGVLESIHDLPAVIDREAFVRDRQAGDVAAKVFEGVALMGLAARADPRLHHSGGLWRENPES